MCVNVRFPGETRQWKSTFTHVSEIETMYGLRSRVYVKVESRLCLRVAFHALPTWLWGLAQ